MAKQLLEIPTQIAHSSDVQACNFGYPRAVEKTKYKLSVLYLTFSFISFFQMTPIAFIFQFIFIHSSMLISSFFLIMNLVTFKAI